MKIFLKVLRGGAFFETPCMFTLPQMCRHTTLPVLAYNITANLFDLKVVQFTLIDQECYVVIHGYAD